MAWSTPDLADITNVLKGVLQTGLDAAAAANIKLSCSSPDTARTTDSLCHLTLYLLHVGRDPHWRNTPVAGPRGQLNSAQPLGLNLSYLLTAWHDQDFASEQRAMSIALQTIHSHPIITQDLIAAEGLAAWLPKGEFNVSIEADTIEEMSRLWQAIAFPIRLSALIRAAVVFLQPSDPAPAIFPPPTFANVTAAPFPVGTGAPLLFAGGAISHSRSAPDPTTIGPLAAVAGATLIIPGNELALPQAALVFLRAPGAATDVDVTAWRTQPAQPGQLALTLPAAYADPSAPPLPPPTVTPLPGLYTLSVGSTAPPLRSNTLPLTIAPRVDGLAGPDPAGIRTVSGGGFVPSATIVAFEAAPLTAVPGPTLAAGQFLVAGNGTSLSFKLPSPPPAKGDYPLLIQVNGVAATPGPIVTVP